MDGKLWQRGMPPKFYYDPIPFNDDDELVWLSPAPTVERISKITGIERLTGQKILLAMDSNWTILELHDRLHIQTTLTIKLIRIYIY